MGRGGFMRWMIRGCELFFFYLLILREERGGGERWMYYAPCFLSGRIQTNFCRSFLVQVVSQSKE